MENREFEKLTDELFTIQNMGEIDKKPVFKIEIFARNLVEARDRLTKFIEDNKLKDYYE